MQDNNIAVRKVQGYTHHRSLAIVLPKRYATDIGIEKGDFIPSKWYTTKNKDLLESRFESLQSSQSANPKGDAP